MIIRVGYQAPSRLKLYKDQGGNVHQALARSCNYLFLLHDDGTGPTGRALVKRVTTRSTLVVWKRGFGRIEASNQHTRTS